MDRLPLPNNKKLNIRHRQMRGVWQAFAGSTYIEGANGASPKEALAELARQYVVQDGTVVQVHGFKWAMHLTLTNS